MSAPQRWDVFCRVVDNYGDAAVCWRLSRQLATEHGLAVRLWIDDLRPLQALVPAVTLADVQQVEDVQVRAWNEQDPAPDAADVVIEAFGCGLPEPYAQAMAQRAPVSLWIILDYLSAEPWVGSHHGLPSPHPRLPLQRFFFFPGFEQGTGGLLREQDLLRRRDAFQCDGAAAARWWREAGFAAPPPGTCVTSLFGYENAAVGPLLEAWSKGPPVVAAVPASRLRPGVADFFGVNPVADGDSLRRDSLEVRFLPFLPQPRYDELLWLCDWNFVRGEDSLVRALWAGRPLVWHLYAQAEGAHWPKLDAFLERYCAGLPPALAAELSRLWRSWNAAPNAAPAAPWAALQAQAKTLQDHALGRATRLAALGDMAANLVQFCGGKVK